MATNKLLVTKNGIPVKRFWRERITQKMRDKRYTTTYPVYFTSSHSPNPEDFNKVWSLTDDKAPRSIEDALHAATVMVEASDTPQTHATVYELRPLYRVGTEFDWKRHQAEQIAYHRTPHKLIDGCGPECSRINQADTDMKMRFRLVSSTSNA